MNITEKVHELYWDKDINCARTTLICLGELFDLELCVKSSLVKQSLLRIIS